MIRNDRQITLPRHSRMVDHGAPRRVIAMTADRSVLLTLRAGFSRAAAGVRGFGSVYEPAALMLYQGDDPIGRKLRRHKEEGKPWSWLDLIAEPEAINGAFKTYVTGAITSLRHTHLVTPGAEYAYQRVRRMTAEELRAA